MAPVHFVLLLLGNRRIAFLVLICSLTYPPESDLHVPDKVLNEHSSTVLSSDSGMSRPETARGGLRKLPSLHWDPP